MSFDIEEDEMFSEDNKADSSFFKFEEIGDRIFGRVVDVYDQDEEDTDMSPQRIFTLETKDGDTKRVGLKLTKTKPIRATDNVREGDLVGLEFVDEYKSDEMEKKGWSPAKTIEAYVKKTDEGDKNEEVEDEFDSIA